MNATDFLLDDKDPLRTALWFAKSSNTYGELTEAVDAVLAHLLTLELAKGSRVVLVGDNSLFWVAAYLGTLRAGMVCVPLPVSTSLDDLAYILRITEARVVFADARFAVKAGVQLQSCQVVTNLDVLLRRHAVALRPPVESDDLAALMFTSGSTGKPRGVMVSHGNIIANTESIIEYLGLNASDRIMAVLPFHYCFGASLLHTHLRAGGSLVVETSFMYPELLLQRMLETECTGFAGVPSHYQILLRHSSLRARSFPHLRYIQQAGGHLPAHLIRELADALPGARVFIMYGQTEATARLSYLPPSLLDSKLGSIGKGIPGVKLTVVHESGRSVVPGEVGEIVAEGRNITQGYWCAPEESARSFRDGRLYTGDLATVDDEGFIYVAGRSGDFLKCGGKRVSCRRLEDLVLGFPEVMEAAVVGMPDEVLVEAVRLFAVPHDGNVTGLEERLRHFCKSNLAPELVPKEIDFLRALPKNSAGKVLKEVLKALPLSQTESQACVSPN
ncbi:MAG: AMP-binding protein [Acidobacteria bacterium]|nr:AMP-binding protein [Acidobacteriota bacterium]